MSNQHTTSQLRALEMFQLMADLPPGNHSTPVRAQSLAAAYCLSEEQINVSAGWFQQVFLPDTSVIDVELLEIDGALVSVRGIHQDWPEVAKAYVGDVDSWVSPRKMFYAGDPSWLAWLGVRDSDAMEDLVFALRSQLQKKVLDGSTPVPPPNRPTPRL